MIRLLRLPVLVCTALAITATSARAASISIPANGSKSFDIFWSLVVGSTDLTALGAFDVTVTNGYADFAIDLTNNTSLSPAKTFTRSGSMPTRTGPALR